MPFTFRSAFFFQTLLREKPVYTFLTPVSTCIRTDRKTSAENIKHLEPFRVRPENSASTLETWLLSRPLNNIPDYNHELSYNWTKKSLVQSL